MKIGGKGPFLVVTTQSRWGITKKQKTVGMIVGVHSGLMGEGGGSLFNVRRPVGGRSDRRRGHHHQRFGAGVQIFNILGTKKCKHRSGGWVGGGGGG